MNTWLELLDFVLSEPFTAVAIYVLIDILWPKEDP